MTDLTARRAALWTQYWATGAAHSLGQSPTTYGGEIARFWIDTFAALPASARLLDIATGNGPLPRLMLETPGREDLRCDAVDLAQVAPGWWQSADASTRERVRFHPGCDAARLPFETASIDLVMSQWGLEYTDLVRSLPELLRVLKPGGRVALVVHHRGGQPVRLAEEELRHLDWLSAPDGPLASARRMVPLLALAATDAGRARLRADPQASAQRDAYNAWMDALDERAAGSICPDPLNEFADRVGEALTLARGGDEAAAAHVIDAVTQAQPDARLRLVELVEHALDEAGVRTLAARLTRGPFRLGELVAADTLLGWTLVIDRVEPIGPVDTTEALDASL